MFFNCHNHGIFSAKDGITKIKESVKKAKSMGHPALAITDHASIGGTLDFYDACKAEGIKPILGCEVYLKTDNKVTENPQERMHLVLLCKNLTGWKNLLKIVRESYDTYYYVPLVTWDSLRNHSEGIIATTACFAGPLAMPVIHDKYDLLQENFNILKDIFKEDLYIELQPNGLPSQQKINIALHKLAIENNIPFIVGIDSHYLNPEDSLAQETLLGINMNSRITDIPKHMESEAKEETEEGEKKEKVRYRFSFEKREFWFMSEQELYELWDKNQKEVGVGIEQGDAPHNIVLMKAIDNLGLIYDKIEEFNIYPDRKELSPKFDLSQIIDPEYDEFKKIDPNKDQQESLRYLRYLCHKGIKRLGLDKSQDLQKYIDRVKHELKDIEIANISDYLLVVADMIKYAQENNIAIGAGRGCLSPETEVLTENGYKQLKDIDLNDKVLTSSGEFNNVINKMDYEIKENLISLHVQHSFHNIDLTKDHKVLIVKPTKTREWIKASNKTKGKTRKYNKVNMADRNWISAQDIKEGDFIFTPWIKNRKTVDIDKIDLSLFMTPNDILVGDRIDTKISLKNDLSLRKISREAGVSRTSLKSLDLSKDTKGKGLSFRQKITEYLSKFNISIEEWIKMDNTRTISVSRIIPFDEDFCFFLGLWIGDGWINKKSNCVGLAFNSDQDKETIEWCISYLNSFGFKTARRQAPNKKLVQIIVSGGLLSNFLKSIFPEYNQTCSSKRLNSLCFLPDNKLRKVLLGLLASDGYISKELRECIDTTSEHMILEIKQCLNFLKIPSNIVIREPFSTKDGYKCNRSYKIQFKGLKNVERRGIYPYNDDGYLSKILSISEKEGTKVSDITVDKDSSYVTSQGCVHNSCAGSLVAYLLNIHCVDSLEYGLIWERFYNAGRALTLPDTDTDTSSINRSKVIEYLISKYGADKVAMICNYSFYRPKSTFKAVCKYYGLIFEEVNLALHDGRHEEEDEEEKQKDISLDKLKQEMKELFTIKAVKEMLEIHPYKEQIERDCMAIVGGIANKSVHASGVVITANPLVELCPVFKRPAKNEDMKAVEQTTEWDMKMLDRSGFLKLDVLGLKTLDIITETNELIVKNGGIKVDWKRLDKSEPSSLKLFTTGKTTGVFQFDYGKELQRLCLEFRPKSFADICALTALGRPGAKSFLGEYMQNRSKSEQEVTVADNRLKPILRETNFVLAYQEQQMEISKQLCGFTLKEADNLRKIVAKKQEDKIGPMREKFIKGYVDGLMTDENDAFSCDKMIKYGVINTVTDCTEIVAKTNAIKIWDAYFSNCEYLFNKSHAVSYSFTSFATAYFKAHHPIEFMTAVLNMNNDGKREAVVPYVYEAMTMGIPFNKPTLIHSKSRFTENGKQIFAGLCSVKDISEKVGDQLSEAVSIEELRRRVCCLAKSHYEALILGGACDDMFAPLNRRSIFETVTLYHDMASKWNEYYKKVDAYKEKIAAAQAKGKKTSAKEPKAPEIQLESWDKFQKVMVDDFSLEEKIAHEVEYLGYAPSDPDFKYMPFILQETMVSFKQKDELKDGQYCFIYGPITEKKEKQDKNDNTMATLRVHPVGAKYGFYLTVFSSIYGKHKDKLNEGSKYIFKSKISEYIGKDKKLVKGLQLDSFKTIEEALVEDKTRIRK